MAKKEIQALVVEQKILNRIHFVRGEKIMLDRDLAELYGIETRVLKQAVKRNTERFPKDFMFAMTSKEINLMVSQNVIPSKSYFSPPSVAPPRFVAHETKSKTQFFVTLFHAGGSADVFSYHK
jgi:hypothetical protein